MFRRVLVLCALAPLFASCVYNRPTLIQGLIGVTNFDEIDLDDSSVGGSNSASVDLDVLPALGFSLQKPVNDSSNRFDIGIEGGMTVGWDTEKIAFRAGGGGAVVAVRADLLFVDLFGGAYVSRTFQFRPDTLPFRIYAGAGPLIFWAWAEDSESDLADNEQFDDSSSEFGTYVRAGIEFDIGPPGTLGLTIQRIDSEVDFSDVGTGDVDGYIIAISLTRSVRSSF